MEKNLNLHGIFAIAVFTLITIFIISCETNDDELYVNNKKEFTLANQLITRAAEGPNTKNPDDCVIRIKAGQEIDNKNYLDGICQLTITYSWTASTITSPSTASISADIYPCINESNSFSIVRTNGHWAGSCAIEGEIVYKKTLNTGTPYQQSREYTLYTSRNVTIEYDTIPLIK